MKKFLVDFKLLASKLGFGRAVVVCFDWLPVGFFDDCTLLEWVDIHDNLVAQEADPLAIDLSFRQVFDLTINEGSFTDMEELRKYLAKLRDKESDRRANKQPEKIAWLTIKINQLTSAMLQRATDFDQIAEAFGCWMDPQIKKESYGHGLGIEKLISLAKTYDQAEYALLLTEDKDRDAKNQLLSKMELTATTHAQFLKIYEYSLKVGDHDLTDRQLVWLLTLADQETGGNKIKHWAEIGKLMPADEPKLATVKKELLARASSFTELIEALEVAVPGWWGLHKDHLSPFGQWLKSAIVEKFPGEFAAWEQEQIKRQKEHKEFMDNMT